MGLAAGRFSYIVKLLWARSLKGWTEGIFMGSIEETKLNLLDLLRQTGLQM